MSPLQLGLVAAEQHDREIFTTAGYFFGRLVLHYLYLIDGIVEFGPLMSALHHPDIGQDCFRRDEIVFSFHIKALTCLQSLLCKLEALTKEECSSRKKALREAFRRQSERDIMAFLSMVSDQDGGIDDIATCSLEEFQKVLSVMPMLNRRY